MLPGSKTINIRCQTLHILLSLSLSTCVLSLSLQSMNGEFVDNQNASISSLTNSTTERNKMDKLGKNESAKGYWFNRYTPFTKCLQLQKTNDCKGVLMKQPQLEKEHSWRLNYKILIRRIACTLEKLSCPISGQSFQLHDIPCQSVCIGILTYCGAAEYGSNGRYDSNFGVQGNYLPGCSDNTLTQPDSSGWAVSPRRHLWNHNPRVVQQVRPHNHHFEDQSSDYYPQKFHLNDVNPYWYDGFRNEFSRRPSRSYFDNPTQTWLAGIRNKRLIQYKQAASRSQQPSDFGIDVGTNGLQSLQPSDCYLLPAGGCDRMTGYFTDPAQSVSSLKDYDVRINSDCPRNLTEICGAMFPKEYTRQQWINGEFTVAAVIRVSQTLWWFGENNRYQPFFRFHMLETLESDIHPYDDKMILTYSWPSRCVCPDEITVDKRYLMLTHSYKARQTLNITSRSVFLTRIRRYTKKLACWRGSCARRRVRNRRRRFPATHWRWGSA